MFGGIVISCRVLKSCNQRERERALASLPLVTSHRNRIKPTVTKKKITLARKVIKV